MIRKEKGITLLEIAKNIGVQQATVQRYECGTIKNIKNNTIIKIAKFLKTTPEYLIGWEVNNIDKANEELYRTREILFSKIENASKDDLEKFIIIIDLILKKN